MCLSAFLLNTMTEEKKIISIDTMGGDKGPNAALGGVNQYLYQYGEESVFFRLFGDEKVLRKLLGKYPRVSRNCGLESLIEEFSIERIRKQKAYTLSGGERRRTEIARSLALEPKFLLLDEPFAGIDPIAVADIKSMIRLLAKRGIGILITDHNVRDTLEITDRAIIINKGTIMTQGTKEEILTSQVAREIYLGKDFNM